MTDRAYEIDSERLLERVEAPGRSWGAIGIGFASALGLVGLYAAGVCAIWVTVEALI